MEGKLLEHMTYVRHVAQTSAAVCQMSGGRGLAVPPGDQDTSSVDFSLCTHCRRPSRHPAQLPLSTSC